MATIVDPFGAWTSSLLTFVKRPSTLPLILITTPVRSASGRLRTVTVDAATAVAPLSSVTRNRTMKVPTLPNRALMVPPRASSNFPSLSKSQSCATNRPSESPEVDATTAVSPANRPRGATVKPARGGALTTIVRSTIV